MSRQAATSVSISSVVSAQAVRTAAGQQTAAAQAVRTAASAAVQQTAAATPTSFPLNIPNPAKSGITITPLSNGKSGRFQLNLVLFGRYSVRIFVSTFQINVC